MNVQVTLPARGTFILETVLPFVVPLSQITDVRSHPYCPVSDNEYIPAFIVTVLELVKLEVATLVVVRYMLDKNLECIGSLHLIKYEYEAPQYVLANYDYY